MKPAGLLPPTAARTSRGTASTAAAAAALLLLLQSAARAQTPVRSTVTASSAELTNNIYDVSVDLLHPAISVLRFSPEGNGRYRGNVFQADSTGVQGVTTHLGRGVIDAPSSYYSVSAAHATTFGNGQSGGIIVTGIKVANKDGAGAVAEETWSLTLVSGDPLGVLWDRTIRFLRPVDLSYLPLPGETDGPVWSDTVIVSRPDRQPAAPDFNPVLMQTGGDAPATVYTSLAGPLPDGKVMQAGQILANALRGFHHEGEQVHLRYRLRVQDTRGWFDGLPAADREPLVHVAWYAGVTKWWRGSVLLPGLWSMDAPGREVRWNLTDGSLPLQSMLWIPHENLAGAGLFWGALDQWTGLAQSNDSDGAAASSPGAGYVASRLTDLGLPSPEPQELAGEDPGACTFACTAEQIYSFTKDRRALAHLIPRLRVTEQWIRAHPDMLLAGPAFQSLSRLYRQVGDERGAAATETALEEWKNHLAATWNADWLSGQDFSTLAFLAAADLLTAPQVKQLLQLPLPGATLGAGAANVTAAAAGSPSYSYSSLYFASLLFADSGQADRAYALAQGMLSRVRNNAHEPHAGVGPGGEPSGPSGYGPAVSVVGIFARALFGLIPSTLDNQFQLQLSIPQAWEAQDRSFTWQYALSADRPDTNLTVRCRLLPSGIITTSIEIAGVGPGVHHLSIRAAGEPVVVEAVASAGANPTVIFRASLRNGVRYKVQFLPAARAPSPTFHTVRVEAPPGQELLKTGQLRGTIEGVVLPKGPAPEVGVSWNASIPTGAVLVVSLSNDGGATWARVANGEWHPFPTAGDGLKYRCFVVRGRDEPVHLESLQFTLEEEPAVSPLRDALPTPTPPQQLQAAQPPSAVERAFLLNFDEPNGAPPAAEGAFHSYIDQTGLLLGPGSLVVAVPPGNSYGAAWLVRDHPFDPQRYPVLEFWMSTRSGSYLALWPEIREPALKRRGLQYQTTDGRWVTPLFALTGGAAAPPGLKSMGDAALFADGRQQQVRLDLDAALQRLFGPTKMTVRGFKVVNYADPSGGLYQFDEISARSRPPSTSPL